MTLQEAIAIFGHAHAKALAQSDGVARAVEDLRLGGFSIDHIDLTLLLLPVEDAQSIPQSDADFLRVMRIAPDLAPTTRKRFARWPRKKYHLALCVIFLAAALLFTGCANVHINIGCRAAAPTLSNAPSHSIQKHPVCGVSYE